MNQCTDCGAVLANEDHMPECPSRNMTINNFEMLPEDVRIETGGHYVTLKPDGSFEVDGELVNADDLERGKKLYAAFCNVMGVA